MCPRLFLWAVACLYADAPPLCRGLIGESVEEESSALWQRTPVERARPGKDEAL